jgi:hypothetical protein
LHAAICAKFFHRADAFTANSVNVKWNAYRAKISAPKRACNEMPLRQKPLFHRVFFNFNDVRINCRRVLRVRAMSFHFDHVIASKRVGRTSHTRFVKR